MSDNRCHCMGWIAFVSLTLATHIWLSSFRDSTRDHNLRHHRHVGDSVVIAPR